MFCFIGVNKIHPAVCMKKTSISYISKNAKYFSSFILLLNGLNHCLGSSKAVIY